MKSNRLICAALLACAALAFAAPASAQTLTFGVAGKSADGTNVVPVLTWSSTQAGGSCLASSVPAGDWIGTQATSGTMTLKAITASTTYSIVCTWPGVSTFSVVWQAPLQNNDGTPYSNPGGFRILYGRTAADLDQSAYIQDPAARSWTSPAGLAAGNWYVGVRAFNTLGLESPTELSTLNPKTISAGVTQTRSMGIVVTVPKPPTGVN